MALLRRVRPSADADSHDSHIELAFRARALRVGFWLGWLSIFAVLGGLVLDVGSSHRWLVLALTTAAAACNAIGLFVPWREWLEDRRGRLIVDLWSGGLIGFVATLVFVGGANFALLLFLTVPFIAVVQQGWRRSFWLAINTATCTVAIVFVPLPVGATAMRLAVVAAVAALALALTRAIRHEMVANAAATARAERERTLTAEANHRIKNNLQAVADLLLLGRPAGGDGQAFDETASRIRSVATVHRLLMEGKESVDAGDLLERIAESVPARVTIETDAAALDPTTAQTLALVANELITNAFQHGEAPIDVRLDGGHETRFRVDDRGTATPGDSTGLGLRLVRQMVEHGLGGRFELSSLPRGGTRAEVVFPGQAK